MGYFNKEREEKVPFLNRFPARIAGGLVPSTVAYGAKSRGHGRRNGNKTCNISDIPDVIKTLSLDIPGFCIISKIIEGPVQIGSLQYPISSCHGTEIGRFQD
jgi:hypothetical protein